MDMDSCVLAHEPLVLLMLDKAPVDPGHMDLHK
jgi:hypothetical protein